MKIIIWIGCWLGGSIVYTILQRFHLGGFISSFLVLSALITLATKLCKNWDYEHQNNPDGSSETPYTFSKTPLRTGKVWHCTCGADNSEGLSYCFRCRRSREEGEVKREKQNAEMQETQNNK